MRVLLAEGLIKANRLVRVINLLPVPADERERLIAWVDATAKEV